MDETDAYCRTHSERLSHTQVFDYARDVVITELNQADALCENDPRHYTRAESLRIIKMDKRWSALFCVLLVQIVSWGAVSPIVRRTPNGEYAVEMTVMTAIEDGPVSDFMLNVPYPKSNQYHDIEWKSPVPSKLLKPYKESGDDRIFFTQENCSEVPEIKMVFNVKFYSVETEFEKITKIFPYKRNTRLYKENIRRKETVENLKNKWIRESVKRLVAKSGKDPLSYARNAYAHVVTNFTYGLPPQSDESELVRTIKARRGDCGLLSAVYVALLRAGGVPSRLVACLRPIEGQECHCWAEFYLEGYGWLPVDVTMDLGATPSFRHFGNLYDHTIVMTQGTNFEVKSAGGRTVLMQFCQAKCWWFWNSGGRCGRPSVSSAIKGTRQ